MMEEGAMVLDGSARAGFAARCVLHSGDADVVPAASWFPQVSELAIDLAAASQRELPSDQVPLCVEEAADLCATWVIPAEAIVVSARPIVRSRMPLLSVNSLSFGDDRNAPAVKTFNFDLESHRFF